MRAFLQASGAVLSEDDKFFPRNYIAEAQDSPTIKACRSLLHTPIELVGEWKLVVQLAYNGEVQKKTYKFYLGSSWQWNKVKVDEMGRPWPTMWPCGVELRPLQKRVVMAGLEGKQDEDKSEFTVPNNLEWPRACVTMTTEVMLALMDKQGELMDVMKSLNARWETMVKHNPRMLAKLNKEGAERLQKREEYRNARAWQ